MGPKQPECFDEAMFLYYYQILLCDSNLPSSPWNPWVHPSFDGTKEFACGMLAPRYPYTAYTFDVQDPEKANQKARYEVEGMNDSFMDRQKHHRIFGPGPVALARMAGRGILRRPINFVALNTDLNGNRFPVPTKMGRWISRMFDSLLLEMPFYCIPVYLRDVDHYASYRNPAPTLISSQHVFQLHLACADMNDLNPMTLVPPAKVVDLKTAGWYKPVLPVSEHPVEQILQCSPGGTMDMYVSLGQKRKRILRQVKFFETRVVEDWEEAQDELAFSLWVPIPP